MRYLIISDIHGNRFGLEAVLKATRGEWDKVLCLGDVVGYGAHPNECCEMLRAVGAQVILGNHDAAALGDLSPETWNEFAAVAIYWTRERLSKDNWVWLRRAGAAQPVGGEDNDAPFWITHGNLQEPFYETYIFDAADAFEEFERLHEHQARLCFFGHTHRAVAFSLELPLRLDSPLNLIRLPQGGTMAVEPDVLYLVNPGSCGQPRDRNPQARCAIYESESRQLEIRAVDYDVEAARAAIYEAGLPFILGDRLLEGW